MWNARNWFVHYMLRKRTAEVEVNDMKTMLANEALSKIWGGVEVPPEPEKPDFPYIYISLGHGKTEPGHNEEIFNKDTQF